MTGNKYQIETDYRGTGPFPLIYQRIYNSIPLVDQRPGWRSSFDRSVTVTTQANCSGNTLIYPQEIKIFRWSTVWYHSIVQRKLVW